MTISKNFVQVNVSTDCEGRNYEWVDTNRETYEEAVARMVNQRNGWLNGVRVVEKTFDSETFEITIKVIKTTVKVYDGFYWNGKVEEIVK